MPFSAAVTKAYTEGGQDQVFRFADSLSADQTAALDAQLASLPPPAEVANAYQLAQDLLSSGGGEGEVTPFGHSGRIGASAEDDKAWFDAGLEAVRAGRIGVMVLAGGQCVCVRDWGRDWPLFSDLRRFAAAFGFSKQPMGCIASFISSVHSFRVWSRRIFAWGRLGGRSFFRRSPIVPRARGFARHFQGLAPGLEGP